MSKIRVRYLPSVCEDSPNKDCPSLTVPRPWGRHDPKGLGTVISFLCEKNEAES